MERYRERVSKEKKRKQRRSGTATSRGTGSEMGGYGAGSEFSAGGDGAHHRMSRHAKGTGISEVDDEVGSMSKRSLYFEGDSRHEYEDGEGYEDGDSREGSIK